MDSVDPDAGFYYDLRTGEVTRGRGPRWMYRMGPYATREEAQHALELARARTHQVDEQEERERAAESLWPPEDQ